MRLADIPTAQLYQQALHSDVRFKSGFFSIALQTTERPLIELLTSLYGNTALLDPDDLCHFHIKISKPSTYRRWVKPQVVFSIDSIEPFEPYPLGHSLPLFEWGLNWCIGTTAHHNLMLHSAVVEKNGLGLIMPAMPGSGKSTLCAALAYRGWRLLSDEFGVVRHDDGKILPMPRAIGLKNQSIDVIKNFAPDAWVGPSYEGTRKGTVAHVAPPPESLKRQDEAVTPRWVIFPRYQAGAKLSLTPQPKSLGFTRLSNNAFNYQLTMEKGFTTLGKVVDSCDCYHLIYSNLDEAVSALNTLAEDGAT